MLSFSAVAEAVQLPAQARRALLRRWLPDVLPPVPLQVCGKRAAPPTSAYCPPSSLLSQPSSLRILSTTVQLPPWSSLRRLGVAPRFAQDETRALPGPEIECAQQARAGSAQPLVDTHWAALGAGIGPHILRHALRSPPRPNRCSLGPAPAPAWSQGLLGGGGENKASDTACCSSIFSALFLRRSSARRAFERFHPDAPERLGTPSFFFGGIAAASPRHAGSNAERGHGAGPAKNLNLNSCAIREHMVRALGVPQLSVRWSHTPGSMVEANTTSGWGETSVPESGTMGLRPGAFARAGGVWCATEATLGQT